MLKTDQIRSIESDVRQVLLERGSEWDSAMRVRGVAELSDSIAALNALVGGDAAREQAALAAYAIHADRLNARIAGSGWPGDGAASAELLQASAALRRLGAITAREHRTFTPAEATSLLELGRISAHIAVVSTQQAREQVSRTQRPETARATIADMARLEASATRMELAATPGGAMPAQSARVATALLRWEVAVGDALARSASLATVQEIARTQTVLYAAAHAVAQPNGPDGGQVLDDAAWLAQSLRDGYTEWNAAATVLGQLRYRGEEPLDRGILEARRPLTVALVPVIRDAAVMPDEVRQPIAVALQEAIAQSPGVAEQVREQVQQARWEAPGWAVHEASQLAVLEDPVHYPAATVWVPAEAVRSHGPRPLTTAAVGHVDRAWQDVEQAATRAAQRSMLLLPRTPARPDAELPATSDSGLERAQREGQRTLAFAHTPDYDRTVGR